MGSGPHDLGLGARTPPQPFLFWLPLVLLFSPAPISKSPPKKYQDLQRSSTIFLFPARSLPPIGETLFTDDYPDKR